MNNKKRTAIGGTISFIIGLVFLLSALYNQGLSLSSHATLGYCIGGIITLFGTLCSTED